MPKLHSRCYQYRTATEHSSFEVQFHVNSACEFFFNTTDIPPEVYLRGKAAFDGQNFRIKKGKYREQKIHDTHYPPQVFSKIFHPLQQAISECVDIFEKSLITREETKWIRYSFGLEGVREFPKPRKPTKDDDSTMTEPIFFDDRASYRRVEVDQALKIEFEWDILRKLTAKSGTIAKRSYRTRDEDDTIWLNEKDGEVYPSESQRLIPWTPEREEWFKRTGNSMRGLMCQLVEFMAIDQKQLEEIIERGQQVLAYTPKETT